MMWAWRLARSTLLAIPMASSMYPWMVSCKWFAVHVAVVLLGRVVPCLRSGGLVTCWGVPGSLMIACKCRDLIKGYRHACMMHVYHLLSALRH